MADDTAQRELTSAHRRFAESYLARLGEEANFVGWVTKLKRRTRKTLRQDRLLVVGDCRVVTFKGKSSLSLAREGHLYNLKKLISLTNDTCKLEFQGFVFEFESPAIDGIILLLRKIYTPITMGWPVASTANFAVKRLDRANDFDVKEQRLLEVVARETELGGLRETFAAYAVLAGLNAESELDKLERQIQCFRQRPGVLTVRQAHVSMKQLALAIRHSPYITSLRVDARLFVRKRDPLLELAAVFEENAAVTELILKSVTEKSMGKLWDAYAKNREGQLSNLIVACCTLKKSMTSVVRTVSTFPLAVLTFNKCQLRGKHTLADLFREFESSKAMWSSLTMITIIDTALGEAGSEALASWMMCAETELAITSLSLENCDLELERLLPAVRKHIAPNLQLLNISRNAIDTRVCDALADAVVDSNIIDLNVSELDMAEAVGPLVEVLLLRRDMRLRANSMNLFRVFYFVSDILNSGQTHVHTLLLNDNGLTGESVLQLTIALRNNGGYLRRLALSRNVPSDDPDSKHAFKKLAALIKHTPDFETLELRGDEEHYAGLHLRPVVEAMEDHPGFAELDIRYQQVGDLLVQLLVPVLAAPATAMRYLALDGNNLTADALHQLAAVLESNTSLEEFVFPKMDIKRMLRHDASDVRIPNACKAIKEYILRNCRTAELGAVAPGRSMTAPVGAASGSDTRASHRRSTINVAGRLTSGRPGVRSGDDTPGSAGTSGSGGGDDSATSSPTSAQLLASRPRAKTDAGFVDAARDLVSSYAGENGDILPPPPVIPQSLMGDLTYLGSDSSFDSSFTVENPRTASLRGSIRDRANSLDSDVSETDMAYTSTDGYNDTDQTLSMHDRSFLLDGPVGAEVTQGSFDSMILDLEATEELQGILNELKLFSDALAPSPGGSTPNAGTDDYL